MLRLLTVILYCVMSFRQKRLELMDLLNVFSSKRKNIHIHDEVVLRSINCPRCSKTFANAQGLGVHLKFVHGLKI